MLQTKWRVNPVWRGSSNEISMHRISRRAPSIRALRILHPSAQTNVPFSLQNCSLFQKKKPPPPHSPPSIYPSISTHSRGCTLGLFAEKAGEWRVEADSHLAGLSLPHVSGFNKKRVSAAVRRWRGRGGGGRALGTRRRGRTSKWWGRQQENKAVGVGTEIMEEIANKISDRQTAESLTHALNYTFETILLKMFCCIVKIIYIHLHPLTWDSAIESMPGH